MRRFSYQIVVAMDVNVEGGQAEAAPVIATAEAVSLSIPIPFLDLEGLLGLS